MSYLKNFTSLADTPISITSNQIVIGNIPGDAVIQLSISDILDLIGSVHGEILFRGAAGWEVLTPGAGDVNKFIQTKGPGVNPVFTTITGLPAGAEGDLVLFTGGSWQVFSPGAVNQVLTSNGPGVAPSYQAFSGLPAGAEGDLVLFTGGSWQVFSPGAANQVLTSNGPGVAPTYQAIPASTPALNGVFQVTSAATISHPTITAALAACAPGDAVYVGPGSYAESFTIPTLVSLISIFGPEVTQIAGAAATGDRVTLGDSSRFQGFSVVLPTDGSAAILNPVTTLAYVERIFLDGNGGVGVGIKQTGSGYTDYKNITYRSGDCSVCFDIQGGMCVFWETLINSGPAAINDGWKLENCFVGMSACGSFASGLFDGLEINENAICLAGSVEIENCLNTIHITADTSQLEVRSLRSSNTSQWDILVDPGITGAKVHVASGELTRTKISIPTANTDVILGFQDDLVGDPGFVFFGELAVGSPSQGKESVFGEGDSYVNGMYVFRNTNGTIGVWSDITAQMASGAGSTAQILPGLTQNNACYIGGPRKFPGIKVDTTIALILGTGTIDFQYWNGATWVSFDVMATQSNFPYTQYGNDVLTRIQSDQIRFSDDFLASWQTTTLNGQNAYWVRIIVNSLNPITTIPTLE